MKELIKASRYIGSRFDLVQSGGGNTSVKEGDFLYVKSSGTYLGDMTLHEGITKLDLNILKREVALLLSEDVNELDKKTLENRGAKILEGAFLEGKKASIETFLHASFKKYVLHTHPIAVTYCMSTDLVGKVKESFPEAYVSEYRTPGIELLLGVEEYLTKAENIQGPVVIFLKNHGLVVSADTAEEALEYTNKVCDTVSDNIGFDISTYKKSGSIFTELSEISEDLPIVSLVHNQEIIEYVQGLESRKINSFCPDIFIYLGWEIPDLSETMKSVFSDYEAKYQAYPSVFTKDGSVFVQGPSYKKLKEIEDVLLCYVKIMNVSAESNVKKLELEELRYLSDWEAEKYRKKN
ncbi:class II aldolase/adducin family protein [Vibrio syngnathi]|uniref:Short chain dehydrogenase n=1 Tax=Vibrio syngnathi TaxID=3034029 RepID=A0AA34XPK4_9VIBR|nr:class II aldolase/adducin family protein [Vibrio syngnathi]ARP39451.1 short chain dehydrogenase [Vibrio syngnathi]